MKKDIQNLPATPKPFDVLETLKDIEKRLNELRESTEQIKKELASREQLNSNENGKG